ncbi:precorrin-8X methylmutase [Proteinivorax tanatarense]|uniref:Precorrin-8X methylmutase n=1 Tax=Proteinivorax tanatarense TaxID=1260629 RepID=A0AAU7VJZ1_9FIRM
MKKQKGDEEMFIKDPKGIENESFRIISEEVNMKDLTLFEKLIVTRVIHTTGDTGYKDLVKIHPKAINNAANAMEKGLTIYTDTKMTLSGINSVNFKKLGGQVFNFTHDEDVKQAARERGETRSMVGLEKAFLQNEINFFAIGNAPTALFQLIDLVKKHNKMPSLVVGVPVGFVGAAESKEELIKSNIPYISVRGRKGGSPVAAAIINGLMKIKLGEYDGEIYK